ncbi:MAG TPA: AAA family ATPase, partial [Solirubrobacteraceae bacterium]|nr:AAA family ATPase [Solirubrobacteraceae bacterium]
MRTADSRSPTADLLERDDELALLAEAAASAAAGAGRVVVVSGGPGSGKTRLLEAAGEAGLDRGTEVLLARGSELESEFAYGVALQLLQRRAAEDPDLLAGAAAPAARLLIGDDRPDAPAAGGTAPAAADRAA